VFMSMHAIVHDGLANVNAIGWFFVQVMIRWPNGLSGYRFVKMTLSGLNRD